MLLSLLPRGDDLNVEQQHGNVLFVGVAEEEGGLPQGQKLSVDPGFL
jgi:hypothetical protein